jgi:C2 domain/EF-hand domain pair
MSEDLGKSPLNLAKWAMKTVEARSSSSAFQVSSRVALDPRISHERRIQLSTAFKEIDKDQSGGITYEEIYNYLKDITDEVDENYVKTIFDSMDSNRDGKVDIDEFLTSYLEQVNGLSEAVAKLRQHILEKKRDLATWNEQLEDAKKTERMNSWGIMEGSLLTVRVVEAQNLAAFAGKPSAYANLLCERQQIATKIIKSERNPNWDETFSFKISAGTGELLVQVFNEGTISKDDLLGTCSVSLQEFRDQQKHERWFHLTGRSNTARVLLSIQWIHKKTDYLMDIIERLERDITADTAEMTRIENELKKLGTNPLGMFKRETWADKIEGKIINEVAGIADKHFHVLNI